MFSLRSRFCFALFLVGQAAVAAPFVPLVVPTTCGGRVVDGEATLEAWKAAGFAVPVPGWVERDGFLFDLRGSDGPVLFSRHRGVHPLLGLSGKNARIAAFLPPTGQREPDTLRMLLVSAERGQKGWELEQRPGGGGLTELRGADELVALLPLSSLETQLQELGFRLEAPGYWRRSLGGDVRSRDWLVRLQDGKVADVFIASSIDLRAALRNEGLLGAEVRGSLLWLLTGHAVYRIEPSGRVEQQWPQNQRFPMASFFPPWRQHNVLRWNDGVAHSDRTPQSSSEPLHTVRLAWAGGEWWAELDAAGALSVHVVGSGDPEQVRTALQSVAQAASIAVPVVVTPVERGFQLGLFSIQDQVPGLGDDRLRVLSEMFRHFELAKP